MLFIGELNMHFGVIDVELSSVELNGVVQISELCWIEEKGTLELTLLTVDRKSRP